jgi:ATP-dependent Clp protease protease subunit
VPVIEQAMERDKFLTPDQAKEFGLVDEVVTSRPAPEPKVEMRAAAN